MEHETRARGQWLWPAALIVLVVAFFYPALVKTFIFRDAFNLFYPYKAVEGGFLRHLMVCKWNPMETMGSSFVGELATGWFYPGNVLYMFLSTDAAFKLFIIAHFVLAASFMWLWLRGRGIGRAAVLCGSLSYTLSGYVLSMNGLPDMLVTAAWLPGSLWMLDLFSRSRSRSWMIAFGASLAMPLLSGRAEGVLINAAAASAWILIRERSGAGLKSRGRELFTIMPLSLLIALCVSMVQFLPSYELGKLSMKGEGFPIEVATLWSFDPRRLLEFLWPSPWGDFWPKQTYRAWDLSGWPGRYPFTISMYMGWTALIGSAAALARSSWRNRILVLGALVIAVLFSMGDHFFLYPLAHRLFPWFRMFRYPEKYMLFVVLILAASGAWGLDVMFDSIGDSGLRRKLIVGGFVLLTALDLGFGNRKVIPYGPDDIYRSRPEALGIIESYSNRNDLPYFSDNGRPRALFRVMRDIGEPTERDLVMIPGRGRFEKYRRFELNTLMPNINYLHGIEELGGYTAAATSDFNDFMKCCLSRKTLELFNVRFAIVSARGSALDGQGLPAAGARYDHGFKVYYLPDAFPRAYLVGKSERVKDLSKSMELYKTHDFRKSVVLEDSPDLPPASEEKDLALTPADVVSYGQERVRIRTRAPSAAWLVLSDSFFPGWEAAVDGAPRTIFKADWLVRAVRVPAGEHEVAFTYNPLPYRVGRAVSIISCLILALLIAIDIIARRR